MIGWTFSEYLSHKGGSAVSTEAEDLKVQQENEDVRALKGQYKYGWHDATSYDEKPRKGVSIAAIWCSHFTDVMP